jgi:hypothetical protein
VTAAGAKNRNYTARSRYYGTQPIMSSEIAEFDYGTYTYWFGYADDSSGTYTGTASSLIKHPCDIAHHVLCTRGGASASEITGISGYFGSFPDARTQLSGYKAHCYLSTITDTAEFVQNIGSQFLVWFYRRHHAVSSPWVAIPWDVGSAPDYRTKLNPFIFTKRYVSGVPRVGMSSISQVRNVVRVNYDYDIRTRGYTQQAFISDTDSRGYDAGSGGEIRDQAGLREPLAADSIALYGRREYVLNLSMSNDPATALSVRNRAFDLMYRPRVEVRFTTFLNGYDLERGMVIQLSEEFDSLMPYPLPGSDGSWYAKNFRVVRVTRREAAATTHDVEAVEV